MQDIIIISPPSLHSQQGSSTHEVGQLSTRGHEACAMHPFVDSSQVGWLAGHSHFATQLASQTGFGSVQVLSHAEPHSLYTLPPVQATLVGAAVGATEIHPAGLHVPLG
jgi:hypothetical protein